MTGTVPRNPISHSYKVESCAEIVLRLAEIDRLARLGGAYRDPHHGVGQEVRDLFLEEVAGLGLRDPRLGQGPGEPAEGPAEDGVPLPPHQLRRAPKALHPTPD